MAVFTCPKCPTTLRIPDGASGYVKCPKCDGLFIVNQSATTTPALPQTKSATTTPALPQPKPPVQKAPSPPPPPPPKPAPAKKQAAEPAFEVVEEPAPRKKQVVDEDDDPPRTKKRWQDDDEEEERPRKKKKSRRYDDDDDWDFQPPTKKGHGSGRVGMLLVTIGSWMYFSLYVLFTAGIFLALVSMLTADSNPRAPRPTSSFDISSMIEVMVVVIGLMGLGNWIISLVGFSFCIAGPENGRALSILTTAVSGVHLFLVMLCYVIAARDLRGYGQFISGANPMWVIFSSLMWIVNMFVPSLIYMSRAISGEYILVVVTGAIEITRLLFTLITIRTLANAAKNYRTAERAQIGIIVACIVLGGGAVLSLFIIVLLREARFSSFQTLSTLGLSWAFILSLAYTIMLIFPALTAGSACQSLGRRSR